MAVYLGMFLYVFIVGYAGKNISKRSKKDYTSGVSVFIAILTLALPVILIGLRTKFVDTTAYINWFNELEPGFENLSKVFENDKGPLWVLYEWIIKTFITKDAYCFLFITATIQAAAVLQFCYRHSIDYVYSVLLFFLSMNFTYMMNGIRQFMAICLILFFSKWIFEKKYLKFVIIVIIAFYIHNSAFIWILALLVIYGKPWNKKMLLFSFLILLSVTFLDTFTNFLESGLSGTAYSGYTEQFDADDGQSIFHTLISAVPVVIAFWKRKEIEAQNDDKLNILINISIFSLMLNVLATFTSGILIGRMPTYFSLFVYILYPLMFEKAFNEYDRMIIKPLCVGGYIFYALYYLVTVGLRYISSILNIYL